MLRCCMKSRYFTLLALIPPAAGEGRPSRRLEGPHFSPRTLIPNPRPSPANRLECPLTQTQLCNSFRMSTCKTPRNHRKRRHFKSCSCNTYARQLHNPFRMNRCTKTGGGGYRLWKSPASEWFERRDLATSRPPYLFASFPLIVRDSGVRQACLPAGRRLP